MDTFPYSRFTTSRNLVYNFIHVLPEQRGMYILFLHGFPSSSYDWRYQVRYFSNKGYGIIAPDTLGFGGTSKELDVQSYKGKTMAQDIAEILSSEKIETVIGVGHDW
jgi:soluble epoxide hydrolase / lipid-phosphate phosphatase